jgi:hypothetical protein
MTTKESDRLYRLEILYWIPDRRPMVATVTGRDGQPDSPLSRARTLSTSMSAEKVKAPRGNGPPTVWI